MEVSFIDVRNRALWEFVNQQFPVDIETHPRLHFYHYFKEKEIILFVPEEYGTIEWFTHELLHLRIAVSGVTITNYLKHRLESEPLLHWTFTENLFEQIGACLEHWKILPLYLAMGFERDLFAENYYMPCFSDMNMQVIRSGMNKEIPAKASVDLFIHKYFSMKSCLNPLFNYDDKLAELKAINEELFSILDAFWAQWNDFDINGGNPYSFKSFTYDFMHDLGTWNIMNICAKQNMRA